MKDEQTTHQAPSPLSSAVPQVSLLVTLAAIVRLCAFSTQRIVWGDEPFYLWLGRNWLTGHGYTFTGYPDVHHTPLYPLLSGLLYLLTGNMELASDVIYVVFGSLLVLPVYLLAREMYGHHTGLIAGLFVAVWPALTVSILHWGTMTEPPYYFFIYTGTWLGLLSLRDRSGAAYPLSGLAFALAYHTRPEAIGYLAAVLGFLVVVRLAERRLFKRATIARLAAVVVGFLVLFAPYAVYVHGETGEWMVSEKAGVTYVLGKSLAYGNTAEFDRLTWGLDSTGKEVYFFSKESYNVSMIEDISRDPVGFARLVYLNTRRFVSSLFSLRLFPYGLMVLVAYGWLRRPWNKERLKTELYLMVALGPILSFLIFFIQDRYVAAVIPGLTIWLAHGIKEVQDWLGETLGNLLGQGRAAVRQVAAGLPPLLVLVYLAATLPTVIAASQSGSWRHEHRTIGLWIRENLPPGGVVMARYPAIAFYADQRWVPTPNAPLDAVLAYAQAKGVTYWVIDERETVKLRPQFAPLLDGEPRPLLSPVRVDTSAPEKLVIYELVGR